MNTDELVRQIMEAVDNKVMQIPAYHEERFFRTVKEVLLKAERKVREDEIS